MHHPKAWSHSQKDHCSTSVAVEGFNTARQFLGGIGLGPPAAEPRADLLCGNGGENESSSKNTGEDWGYLM